MALTRQQKETRVQEVTNDLAEATSIVFMTYDAVPIRAMNELRHKLHEAGVSMRVVPKRLLKIALDAAKLAFDPSHHQGQMAFVWSDDISAPARVLARWALEQEHVKLVAGVMDQTVISDSIVQQLATLPGRQELLARLVGTIAAPLQGFVGTLAAVPRSMIYVLKAVSEDKK